MKNETKWRLLVIHTIYEDRDSGYSTHLGTRSGHIPTAPTGSKSNISVCLGETTGDRIVSYKDATHP